MKRAGRYPGGGVDPLTILVVAVLSALSLTLAAQADARPFEQGQAQEIINRVSACEHIRSSAPGS